MQNGAFYAADADCVGDSTGKIPWKLNREWLRALSRSGSPLFVSCDPNILSPEKEAEIKEAFRYASEQKDVLTPINWMETLTPSLFRLNGETVSFNWYDSCGADDFIPSSK